MKIVAGVFLIMFVLALNDVFGCEEIKEFGCQPYVDCMPCSVLKNKPNVKGWCWIK